MTGSRDRQKMMVAVVFGAPILWQLYAFLSAVRHVPAFMTLFAGLGGPLPPVTRFLFAAYPYWWILPVLFTALSVDVWRRDNPPLPYFVSVLVASTVSALALHAWLNEAFFAPLFTILEKIG
jgi:hypothetical protein